MSHPAVVAIKDESATRIYFDRDASHYLSWDAALDGQNSTLARVRESWSFEGTSTVAAGVIGWAEAVLAIDQTRKTLTWFNGEDGPGPPRLANYVLERSWPGWTAQWAPETSLGIPEVLGIDLPPLPNPRLERPAPTDYSTFDGAWPTRDGCENLPISVRFGNHFVCWRADVSLEQVAYSTPKSVLRFARSAYRSRLAGDGWGADLGIDSSDEMRQAFEGVHIDANTKEVSWWSHFGQYDIAEDFRRNWPGYAIRSWGDNHERHEQELGGIPLRPDWAAELQKARRSLAHLISVRSYPGGFQNIDVVFNALATLADDGRPLAPARFIDSSGHAQGNSSNEVTHAQYAEPAVRRGSTMQAMYETPLRRGLERQVRSDPDYDDPRREFWHFDVQGTLSPAARMLRDVLRALRVSGHALEVTDPTSPNECALRIELSTGHWIDLRCYFDTPAAVAPATAADETATFHRLYELTHITTLITDHPQSLNADRVHRVERHFHSADDAPPLPRGFQYGGGLLMSTGGFGDTAAARPLRTILRSMWETCLHADLYEVFFHWFDGWSPFEVNLSWVNTDVIDGRRWYVLGFEYERWAGETLFLSFPLKGDELSLTLLPELPVDISVIYDAHGDEALLQQICSLLGMEIPDDEHPGDWLRVNLQETAYDAYDGRVQQAAFAPEARG